MSEQKIFMATENYIEINDFLKDNRVKKLFLVCDASIEYLNVNSYFVDLGKKAETEIIKFNDFSSNPTYESVVKGVSLFNSEKCDAIIAVGGGSSIDVAKCVKLYSNMNHNENYLHQKIIPNEIPFLAMPTTAGTGSESTRFAVIYYNEKKQSITDESIIPDTVILDSSTLNTLPLYHKKSTLFDAFCHAIESFWSVNSTDESKEYSKKAIKLIMDNMDGYIANDSQANTNMFIAANMAGKAINISQTTAGHAMCYKITSLFGVAHGHAAALVDRKLWTWMIDNIDKCTDKRGPEYLKTVFDDIAVAMNCENAKSAAQKFNHIFDDFGLSVPKASDDEYEILKSSVNPERLNNNPIKLDTKIIDELYHIIL